MAILPLRLSWMVHSKFKIALVGTERRRDQEMQRVQENSTLTIITHTHMFMHAWSKETQTNELRTQVTGIT